MVTYHQVPNRIPNRSREAITLISILASIGMCLGFGLGNYVYLIKAMSDILNYSNFQISGMIYLVSCVLLYLTVEPEKIKYTASVIAAFIFFASIMLLSNNIYDLTVGGISPDLEIANVKPAGLLVGVALFAFESISLIVNVRRTTRLKKDMRRYTRITFIAASVFFIILALSFHLVYGRNNLHPIAFDYFKDSRKWVYYLKFLVALNPLFAVPFSTITIIEIFEKVKPLSTFIK